MKKNLSSDYYTDDGCPIKCPECDHENIKSRTIDIIAGMPCEVSYSCGSCDEELGYWAYGSYDPSFMERPIVPPEMFKI